MAFTWTDPVLTTSNVVRNVHVQELRDALAIVYSSKGIDLYTFIPYVNCWETLNPGSTKVRFEHLNALRWAVEGITPGGQHNWPQELGNESVTNGRLTAAIEIRYVHIQSLRDAIDALHDDVESTYFTATLFAVEGGDPTPSKHVGITLNFPLGWNLGSRLINFTAVNQNGTPLPAIAGYTPVIPPGAASYTFYFDGVNHGGTTYVAKNFGDPPSGSVWLGYYTIDIVGTPPQVDPDPKNTNAINVHNDICVTTAVAAPTALSGAGQTCTVSGNLGSVSTIVGATVTLTSSLGTSSAFTELQSTGSVVVPVTYLASTYSKILTVSQEATNEIITVTPACTGTVQTDPINVAFDLRVLDASLWAYDYTTGVYTDDFLDDGNNILGLRMRFNRPAQDGDQVTVYSGLSTNGGHEIIRNFTSTQPDEYWIETIDIEDLRPLRVLALNAYDLTDGVGDETLQPGHSTLRMTATLNRVPRVGDGIWFESGIVDVSHVNWFWSPGASSTYSFDFTINDSNRPPSGSATKTAVARGLHLHLGPQDVLGTDPGGGNPYTDDTWQLEAFPAAPAIGTNTSSISRTVDVGQNGASHNLYVWNAGTGTLTYSVTDNSGWLSVSNSPNSSTGVGDQKLHVVTFSTSGQPVGSYSATITITDTGGGGSPNSPLNIPVTLNVLAVDVGPTVADVATPADTALYIDYGINTSYVRLSKTMTHDAGYSNQMMFYGGVYYDEAGNIRSARRALMGDSGSFRSFYGALDGGGEANHSSTIKNAWVKVWSFSYIGLPGTLRIAIAVAADQSPTAPASNSSLWQNGNIFVGGMFIDQWNLHNWVNLTPGPTYLDSLVTVPANIGDTFTGASVYPSQALYSDLSVWLPLAGHIGTGASGVFPPSQYLRYTGITDNHVPHPATFAKTYGKVFNLRLETPPKSTVIAELYGQVFNQFATSSIGPQPYPASIDGASLSTGYFMNRIVLAKAINFVIANPLA